MIKSLTVSIDDIEKADRLTISGAQNVTEFTPNVTISVGQYKISVNSQDLAEALKTVVDFQTPPKVLVESGSKFEPMPTGISSLGWTK